MRRQNYSSFYSFEKFVGITRSLVLYLNNYKMNHLCFPVLCVAIFLRFNYVAEGQKYDGGLPTLNSN